MGVEIAIGFRPSVRTAAVISLGAIFVPPVPRAKDTLWLRTKDRTPPFLFVRKCFAFQLSQVWHRIWGRVSEPHDSVPLTYTIPLSLSFPHMNDQMNMGVVFLGRPAKRVDKIFLPRVIVIGDTTFHQGVDHNMLASQLNRCVMGHPYNSVKRNLVELVINPEAIISPF